jgi:hypothetical protein
MCMANRARDCARYVQRLCCWATLPDGEAENRRHFIAATLLQQLRQDPDMTMHDWETRVQLVLLEFLDHYDGGRIENDE